MVEGEGVVGVVPRAQRWIEPLVKNAMMGVYGVPGGASMVALRRMMPVLVRVPPPEASDWRHLRTMSEEG